MSLLDERIKTRGYWQIRVSPASFKADRIAEITRLKSLVRDIAVEASGVSFPLLRPSDFAMGKDWIGQEFAGNEYGQTWRFYQSGHFVLYEGFLDDWCDQSILGPDKGWRSLAQLSVLDVLAMYWQTFELASRFATAIPGDDEIAVSVHAFALQDRELHFRFPKRTGLRARHFSRINDFEKPVSIAREALIATPCKYAVAGARELFFRFEWEPDPEFLRTLLTESGFRC